MKTIKTKRLLLRALRQSDLIAFYEYAKKSTIGPSAGWMPHPNIEYSKEILTRMIKKGDVWAITLKEADVVIGTIGLHSKEKEKDVSEIGYVLDDVHWGYGIVAEAVLSVLDYAFQELKKNKIICKHELKNNQSKRVIEKTGFAYMHQEEKEHYDKTTITLLVYEIKKENYLKGNINE